MNKAPSFQFYAQDFLTGVVYLTNEEIGIYIKMLCKQWTDEKIPKKRLGLLVGYSWENLSEELKCKFSDKGEFVVNERLEKEREKKVKFLNKQVINGSKGGRPKKNTKTKNPSKTQKKPLEEEDEIEDRKRNKNLENEYAEIFPTFEDFWDEYDKKVGKKDKIKKKWDSLNQNQKEEIMDYIPNYKISQPKKQYRKNPETFLNNEGWMDELILTKETGVNQNQQERIKNNLTGW